MRRIKFQNVKFKNFLSYGNNWQTFYFGNGLHIIQGVVTETEKSNGSGKTSLTELIPFALFGKTIKKITKGNIVNWYNEKNCEVRLSFTVDDVPYEIRRGIKPNKLEVYCNGNQLPKLASAVDFQNQIEDEIVGMDFGTFQNLIYFSPNNTISIINASKPEKRKFLESLFDLSVYSKMLETVNGKIKANSDKTITLKTEIEGLEREVERIQQEIDNTVIPKSYRYRDKFLALDMQYKELEKKEFNVSERELDDAKKIVQKCKDTLKEWEKKLSDATSLKTLHESMIARSGDIEEIKKKREEILNEIKLLEMCKYTELEEDDLADDLQAKELMKEEVSEIVKELQELDKKKAVYESMIHNDDDNINIAKSRKRATEGICDSCGQLVTKEILEEMVNQQVQEYEQDKREHQSALDTLVAGIQDLRKRKEELFKKVKMEAERISGLQEDIRIKRGGEETLKRLQERLSDIEDPTEREKSILESKSVIEEQSKIISEAIEKTHLSEIDVELYQSKLDRVQTNWDEYQKHKEILERLEIDVKQAHDYYYEMVEIQKKMEEDLEGKKNNVHDIKLRIEEDKEMIKKANSLSDYLNYIRASLKDENVKRFAISSLIPFLNQQTNMYLSESGFPYIATLDSWLDVTIRGLGVQEVSYGSLSGGETKCIDMAVQLACNDIASMMAKTSLDLMVLDEVLDSSVDKLGVQALLNIIRVRQRKNNDSVYIITHRNEIDEFTFDSIVRIISEDKFSRVEIEQ